MKKRTWIKAILITAVALIILGVGIMILNHMDQDQYKETRGEMTEGFGQLKTIEWNGVTYREKPAVTTILIAGIDKVDDSSDSIRNQYRNGGQADFLMLIAIDHTDKVIHQLQIDRDTMTDVAVLGMFGNEVGTRILQICLSHGFGKTPEDNARYTIVDDAEETIRGSEVIISCATYFENDICSDDCFEEGVLVIPVHTRGFTNCDLFFDKVFADDTSHVDHFKNFSKFKYYAEVCDVVNGRSVGRENDKERILAYNIGISIHDINYAAHIYQMIEERPEIYSKLINADMHDPTNKFWI